MQNRPPNLVGQQIDHASDRDGVKLVLAAGSWLLIRPSGTEPVLRIYAEARSDEQVEALLKLGGELASRQIDMMQNGKTKVIA
jgi:phosphomannomutase